MIAASMSAWSTKTRKTAGIGRTQVDWPQEFSFRFLIKCLVPTGQTGMVRLRFGGAGKPSQLTSPPLGQALCALAPSRFPGGGLEVSEAENTKKRELHSAAAEPARRIIHHVGTQHIFPAVFQGGPFMKQLMTKEEGCAFDG